MRRTLFSVVLTLCLLIVPVTPAAETTEPKTHWFVTLQELVEDTLDVILFWNENPNTGTGETPGMPEPLG